MTGNDDGNSPALPASSPYACRQALPAPSRAGLATLAGKQSGNGKEAYPTCATGPDALSLTALSAIRVTAAPSSPKAVITFAPAHTAILRTPTLGASSLVGDSSSPPVESPKCLSEADAAREVDRLVSSLTTDFSDEVSNMSPTAVTNLLHGRQHLPCMQVYADRQ